MNDLLSIIIPTYNEEKNISYIYQKIKESAGAFQYEIIFIDDGSFDNTFNEIKHISDIDNQAKGISFSRNFGHQIALLAGLNESKGDIVVMMDADGQHPAELIPILIDKVKEGYDIVNTRRKTTEGIGFFKKVSSRFYYSFLNFLTDIKIEYSSSDFRAMTRKAVDAFLQLEETNRFTRGLISWMGFNQAIVEYNAPKRYAGETKYTLKKMLRFGIDGITSFSAKPLKISFYFGLITLLLGVIYGIYAIAIYTLGKAIPGWTSILLTVLFIGGVQLLGIGILGEYLAKIYNEIKGRPHYFIKNRCGK
ncbi:MAG TPA: glycosyltransferase family 2 protein [Bacteroidales bacterium]|nr:glycosyltransferase family 2 protein [Bacteroidales bacterium]